MQSAAEQAGQRRIVADLRQIATVPASDSTLAAAKNSAIGDDPRNRTIMGVDRHRSDDLLCTGDTDGRSARIGPQTSQEAIVVPLSATEAMTSAVEGPCRHQHGVNVACPHPTRGSSIEVRCAYGVAIKRPVLRLEWIRHTRVDRNLDKLHVAARIDRRKRNPPTSRCERRHSSVHTDLIAQRAIRQQQPASGKRRRAYDKLAGRLRLERTSMRMHGAHRGANVSTNRTLRISRRALRRFSSVAIWSALPRRDRTGCARHVWRLDLGTRRGVDMDVGLLAALHGVDLTACVARVASAFCRAARTRARCSPIACSRPRLVGR